MEQIKPDKRYIIAEEEDLILNLKLNSNFNDLNEFNNTRVISLSELFTKERNESTKYRIYGNINYFSFFRNKKTNPSNITDLFNDDYLTTGFNLEDFFDIKVFRPLNLQSYYNQTDSYIEKLSAITNSSDYKLNFFTYGKNIYNEKIYNFKFNVINSNPNELIRINNNFIYNNNIYLGFIPKPSNSYQIYEKVINKNDYIIELTSNTVYGYVETEFNLNINQIVTLINANSNFTDVQFTKYFIEKLKKFLKIYNLNVDVNNLSKNLRFIRNYLDIGNSDYESKILLDLTQSALTGNFIFFDKENYNINEIIKKEYLIKLQLVDTNATTQAYISENYGSFIYPPLNNNTITIDFWFKFNPFYKIELKKYDSVIDEIYNGILSTLIPPQTAIIDNDKIIWKDLLLYGDPDNYDNPFINNIHYFFNDINFYLKPDLSDRNTFILMNDFVLSFVNNNFKFNKDNINLKPLKPKNIC
jgi:hypothetical protein